MSKRYMDCKVSTKICYLACYLMVLGSTTRDGRHICWQQQGLCADNDSCVFCWTKNCSYLACYLKDMWGLHLSDSESSLKFTSKVFSIPIDHSKKNLLASKSMNPNWLHCYVDPCCYVVGFRLLL
jgi:hypothetical protein